MDIDLRGRVNNTKLAPTNCLLPLFEAIINSIHAIEEKGKIRGSIEITIERDHSQGVLEAEHLPLVAGPIWGFAVQDNGIGFTDDNFRSFETSDTTKKVSKGGKGVGRLVWLKAFDKAEIESQYAEAGKLWRRRFDFTCTQHGIEGHSLEEVAEVPRAHGGPAGWIQARVREILPQDGLDDCPEDHRALPRILRPGHLPSHHPHRLRR